MNYTHGTHPPFLESTCRPPTCRPLPVGRRSLLAQETCMRRKEALARDFQGSHQKP